MRCPAGLTHAVFATVPLRNTNLPHLRDGFARGLTARLKLPHVSSAMSEADGDVST